MPYQRQGREPMRGGAVTGGILAVSSAAVAFLLTFGGWAYEPPSIFSSPTEQSLWELGGRLGFFPFGFYGVVAFVNTVLSVIFLSMGTTRQRQGTAVSLLMAAFIQFIVLLLVGVSAEEHRLSGDGSMWVLTLLAVLILIAGSITALVGSRSPAVEAVAPPPVSTEPASPQDEPERSLTSSIEELAALRDKGFLTEEEFELKRRKTLGLD